MRLKDIKTPLLPRVPLVCAEGAIHRLGPVGEYHTICELEVDPDETKVFSPSSAIYASGDLCRICIPQLPPSRTLREVHGGFVWSERSRIMSSYGGRDSDVTSAVRELFVLGAVFRNSEGVWGVTGLGQTLFAETTDAVKLKTFIPYEPVTDVLAAALDREVLFSDGLGSGV